MAASSRVSLISVQLTLFVVLCACTDSTEAPPEARSIGAYPVAEAQNVAIARWIDQLGSQDFREREAASETLERIGFPAMDALRKATHSADAEIARRATRLIQRIENSLDQLLADYRTYGLPLPPEDARLVRFVSGGGGSVDGKPTPLTYSLGFLLQPATRDQPPLLLVGTQEVRFDADTQYVVIEPTTEALKDVDPCWRWESTFALNAGLAIALQCKARGWEPLARKLWALSLLHWCGFPREAFYQPPDLPNRTAAAYLAWAHYGNELVKPDTDRALIARHIQRLLSAEPRLNNPLNRGILKSLEAALVPSTAAPGSIERLVDDLTETCNTGPYYGEHDPYYFRVVERGFDAVPALIEYLDDNRLTRSIRLGFNNFPTWNLRVQDVASDLLEGLSGDDLGKNWVERAQGWAVAKSDAQTWWNDAQRVGEEAYVLTHVLTPDITVEGTGEVHHTKWPNNLMLRIITVKYPHHLPKLYRTVLDERPYMQSWPIAEAISRSSLPSQKKWEVFLQASTHENLDHRRAALHALQQLDSQQFLKLLLATLESLPNTPMQPYWRCSEGTVAHLVLATDDPRAWRVLRTVAKRADVGLRMTFLNVMTDAPNEDHRRQQRLEFLAAFLDDTAVRDEQSNRELFNGPYAGFMFPRLAVRDFAAMQIARILKLSIEPKADWTAQEWEAFRSRVKATLDR